MDCSSLVAPPGLASAQGGLISHESHQHPEEEEDANKDDDMRGHELGLIMAIDPGTLSFGAGYSPSQTPHLDSSNSMQS